MRFFRFQPGWAVATLISLVAIPCFAQLTSGNISGTVFDPTGATIPNASVVATNDATGVQSTTTTTSAGDYRLQDLSIGMYTLTVTSPGFKQATVKDINVELNVTVTTNVTMQIGQATTTVEVSESPVAIDTTTAQVQTTFESKQMTDLPIASTGNSGQGVLNLSLLNAGVTTSGSVGAGTGPSVGGQRPRNNNFTIEGVDNNSISVTGPLVQVPNDAVSEFTVLQNQFSPDFGHSSGGQFNIVTKTGTNAFHGELYEYFQNRNLNAADNLSAVSGTPLHPRYDNNRFGGNFGGPIKKNKLFFFVDYEYNPVGEASIPGLIYAPTQAGYNTIAATPGINQTNLAILKKYLGTAPTAVSPSVQPYPLLGTLALGPEYNLPTPTGTPIEIGQLPVSGPNYFNTEESVATVDYSISDRDSLRGRFILNRSGIIDTTAQLPAFYTTEVENFYLFAFSEYHNFSPTLINEFRLGYNRQRQNDPVGNQTFPGLDAFPNLVINDLSVQIGPDPSFPQYTFQNNYELTDSITWTKNTHTFKFGFDGERQIAPQSFTQRSRGDYEYSYLSDYLFDFTPDSLAQRSQGSPIYWGNRWLWGWYGNDTWKIRPNFTLNLGLRYEYQTVPAGEDLQSLNSISSVPGLISFTSPKPQWDAFMPRIGVAYSPGTSGKTSIRAGFGINYDILFDNFGILTLPPQLETTQDVTANGKSNFLANGGLPPTGPSTTFTQAQSRAATAGYVPNQVRPKSVQWNFGIEHEFGGNYVFESRYLGTRGEHLPVQDRIDREPIVTAQNALPVFWSMPSQATLNSLTSTLTALTNSYNAAGYIPPAYAAAGFSSPITAYMPYGNSIYHGWANQLTRRFSNGLQFIGSYTWSHNIDDSTAEVFSTVLTPRRPENPQNLSIDRADSALDHRNRVSLEVMYDVPYFKHSNWFMKNIVGNWEIAPIYSYQTGTWFTVQSGVDSNLDQDSWPDRVFVNPNNVSGSLGSGVTPLTNSAGAVVGYLVNNPNAKYAQAPSGTLPDAARNTEQLRPINDVDLTLMKRFNVTERYSLQISALVTNIFNHPQYVAGELNDVGVPTSLRSQLTSVQARLFTEPDQPTFHDPTQVFSSNPRTMMLALKFIF